MAIDFGEVLAIVEKVSKQYIGASYKGCSTRTDEINVYLDIEFYKADKTVDKTTLTFPKPKDGVGIKDVKINDISHLIITLTDNTIIDAGEIKGSGGSLTPIQERTLKQIEPLLNENTLYYREGSKDNPKEGDRRDTGLGIGRNGNEVYTGGKWVKKIEVGSVGTDMITLRDGLNDIKVKEEERTFNLIRKRKTEDGIQVGSSFSPLELTTSDSGNVKICYPDHNEPKTFNGVTDSSVPVKLPAYFMLDWQNKDAIADSFVLKTLKESRIRIRVYYTEETDLKRAVTQINDETLVYESMPDTEFKNPENPNYGGVLIPIGESETQLRNEMYLTGGRKYVIEFDSCVENSFLGDGNVPFFAIKYFDELSEYITTENLLEDRLTQDIVLDRNMWLMTYAKKQPEEKKTETINLIGNYDDDKTLVGNGYDNTVIQSKSKVKVRLGERNGEDETVATEEWVSKLSFPKVFDGADLKDGETGLIIQTNPPTYIRNQPELFPKYELLNYLLDFRCEFCPNLQLKQQNILLDNSNSITMSFIANEKVLLKCGYYNTDGYHEVIIDTSFADKPPEGHRYPAPYIPCGKREEEERKIWKMRTGVRRNNFRVMLIDPNGGRWQVDMENATHIGEGGLYTVGTSQNFDEPLKQLNNICIETWDVLEDKHSSKTIDETVESIEKVRLSTKCGEYVVDVLDPIAIHKYANKTTDFRTMFEKSGLYRCFNMTENIPKGYIVGDNDFYVNVYFTEERFVILEALDVRSGKRFTLAKINNKWGEWVESGGKFNALDLTQGENIKVTISDGADGTVTHDLFVDNAVNPKLLPKEILVGNSMRIIQNGNKMDFQQYIGSQWFSMGTMG